MSIKPTEIILAIVGLLLALVAFGAVLIPFIAREAAQPALTPGSQNAPATECEGLSTEWFTFTPTGITDATPATLSTSNCVVEARFTGARSIFLLLPLVMVGSLIGFGAVWIRNRYT